MMLNVMKLIIKLKMYGMMDWSAPAQTDWWGEPTHNLEDYNE